MSRRTTRNTAPRLIFLEIDVKKIAMCCSTPLIGTLIFPGKEMFCTVCRSTYGMFEYPSSTEATPELVKIHNQLRAEFLDVAKDVIPPRAQFKHCDLCSAGEYHSEHASEDEIRQSEISYAALKTVRFYSHG